MLNKETLRAVRLVDQLINAALVWRNTRQVIFDSSSPSQEMWTNLALAEQNLMTIARQLDA